MASKLIIREMNVSNFNYTMQSYSLTVAQDASADLSKWTVTLTKVDGTTIVNPSVGNYTGIVSIQVDGLAYVGESEAAKYYYTLVYSDNTMAMNSQNRSDLTTYSQVLSGNATFTAKVAVSSGGCFSGNMTMKMATGEDKLIGQVLPGDLIKSYDSNTETIIDNRVEFSSAKMNRVEDHYDKYTFSNGTIVEVVGRDRLYNVEDNKMKWMDQWTIGEHGLTYEGVEVELVKHEVINEPVRYFDITCPFSNYFINGMLAGQKTARYPFFKSRMTSSN